MCSASLLRDGPAVHCWPGHSARLSVPGCARPVFVILRRHSCQCASRCCRAIFNALSCVGVSCATWPCAASFRECGYSHASLDAVVFIFFRFRPAAAARQLRCSVMVPKLPHRRVGGRLPETQTLSVCTHALCNLPRACDWPQHLYLYDFSFPADLSDFALLRCTYGVFHQRRGRLFLPHPYIYFGRVCCNLCLYSCRWALSRVRVFLSSYVCMYVSVWCVGVCLLSVFWARATARARGRCYFLLHEDASAPFFLPSSYPILSLFLSRT